MEDFENNNEDNASSGVNNNNDAPSGGYSSIESYLNDRFSFPNSDLE